MVACHGVAFAQLPARLRAQDAVAARQAEELAALGATAARLGAELAAAMQRGDDLALAASGALPRAPGLVKPCRRALIAAARRRVPWPRRRARRAALRRRAGCAAVPPERGAPGRGGWRACWERTARASRRVRARDGEVACCTCGAQRSLP